MRSIGRKPVAGDRALPVDRLAQRVDHAPDQCVTHRHRSDPARAADDHALGDSAVIAHDDHADAVFFQVEGGTHHPVGELHQFLGANIGQPMHTRNPITGFHHGTDIADRRSVVENFRFVSANHR